MVKSVGDEAQISHTARFRIGDILASRADLSRTEEFLRDGVRLGLLEAGLHRSALHQGP